jgi:hypothetical protein
VTGRAKRECDAERGIAEPGGHRFVRQPAHATQVCNPEGGLVGDALKRNIQLATDGRAGPVGADAPSRPDADETGGSVQQRGDPAFGLAGVIDQVHQPVPPKHVGARRRE